MKFIQVRPQDKEELQAVYSILEICGKDMYEKKGLTHWLKPYPMENIIRDAEEKFIFLIEDEGEYVATITFTVNEDSVYAGKVAVLPKHARKSIGRKMVVDFGEEFAFERNKNILKVDVYVKSQHAVDFFKASGYEIVGEKSTTNFRVYLMEKHLNGDKNV